MTPFEESLLKQLRSLNRTNGPVKGTILSQLIGRPLTTIYYYLHKLEDNRAVSRPNGPRSGWVAA